MTCPHNTLHGHNLLEKNKNKKATLQTNHLAKIHSYEQDSQYSKPTFKNKGHLVMYKTISIDKRIAKFKGEP